MSVLSVKGLRDKPQSVLRLIEQICARNNWNCDGFVAHIQGESGWNPAALNQSSGASGLIQWLPSTAKLYGTTAAAIRKMPIADQLLLAEQYFVDFEKRHPLGPWDFTVAGLGTGNVSAGPLADGQVLYAAGSPGAKGNPGLQDQTGAITVGRARSYLRNIAASVAGRPRLETDSDFTGPEPPTHPEKKTPGAWRGWG